MRNAVFHFVLFLILFISSCRYSVVIVDKTKFPAPDEISTYSGPDTCVYEKRYSVYELRTKFPFSHADSITLESFSVGDEQIHEIKEMVSLNRTQQDSLANILLNFQPAEVGTRIQLGCYWPHHKICFYSCGKILCWIEICFQCNAYRSNLSKDYWGYFCDNKYQKLKAFFKEAGITYFPGK
jgi:hypothetical protein